MKSITMTRRELLAGAGALAVTGQQAEPRVAVERLPWPVEVASVEMFSALAEGPGGRIYAGTCTASKRGACLIALEPASRRIEVLADMQQVCGEVGARTFPQSKIHSQIQFDSRGVAWFGTHSYEWNTLEQFQKSPGDYTGGHLISYDSATRRATDHGILVPHESIISLALAESAGKVYCVMHPTGRFVVYDLRTGKVSDKGAILGYPNRVVVALRDGRGYTFTLQGDVVRYDPRRDALERLAARVPLWPGEADATHNNPFDLAVSEDEKSIYGIGWTSGQLFEYRPNDGPNGSMRVHGPAFGDNAVPGVRKSLGMAMKQGRDGKIYYAGYYENRGRLARFDPATGERRYLGRMSAQGRLLGAGATADGTCAAMCVARDGTIYVCDFDNKQTYFNWFKPQT